MGEAQEQGELGGVRMSFDSLLRQAGVGKVAEYEGYYEGTTRLDSLGVSLPPAVRVLEMAAPFPKMAVDVLAEVLNPEGYILSGDNETPKLLRRWRSEEHTSELQSRGHLVCRLLLEKKKKNRLEPVTLSTTQP